MTELNISSIEHNHHIFLVFFYILPVKYGSPVYSPGLGFFLSDIFHLRTLSVLSVQNNTQACPHLPPPSQTLNTKRGSHSAGNRSSPGLRGETVALVLFPLGHRTVVVLELDTATVRNQAAFLLVLQVLVAVVLGEAPLLRDEDLLATGELELGTTQGLDDLGLETVAGAHRHDRLANVDAGNGSLGLTEGTTHSSLESISSGTRQHLVDADDVERVQTHTDVELILAAELDQVLVAANTSSFQRLGAQLFVLIGHQVHAQREVLDVGLLATEIEDTDLRIWDTTTEPRLRVRLVLTVAITSCGTSSHFDGVKFTSAHRNVCSLVET